MAVSDSVGVGIRQGFTTASTTIAIEAGRIVEFDSSGDIIYPTTTPVADNLAGVTVTKVSARTTTSKEKIVVQVSGLVHITCTANSAFTHGGYVRPVTLTGYASTAAAATTITATALVACVGRVVTPDATTEGTTVIVRLTG